MPTVELWVDTTTPLDIVEQAGLPNYKTWQTWFSSWLKDLQPTGSPINQYEVSLLLTDDTTIRQLNADYRYQDQATDVLAFAAQETEFPGAQAIYQTLPLPLGDVIISVETAQRQRHQDSYSLTQELAWLAAHGFLHLLGWDHADDTSLKNMLLKQDQLLQQIRF
ncbi:MAG: rRNA maturation RNase YbeY [Symploca sp. SIO2G7]|nr:rRNA maturation RNase YbeY [Symploca sp. SIO2G7]